MRSAEQWAELADRYQEMVWRRIPKAKNQRNMFGFRYAFLEAGSVLDGWKESLFACCCPTQTTDFLGEELVFMDTSTPYHYEPPVPQHLQGHSPPR